MSIVNVYQNGQNMAHIDGIINETIRRLGGEVEIEFVFIFL